MGAPSSSLSESPAEQPLPPQRGRPFTTFLLVATLALCVLVALLVRETNRLRAQLHAADQALIREQTKDSLAVGESVGPLSLTAADGAGRQVDFTGPTPKLVLLISGHCPYCDETIPVWERTFRELGMTTASAPGAEVVCIQVDAHAAAELKPLNPPLSPLMPRSGVASWLSRVPIAPAAVLVGTDAVVKRAWFGIPSDRDQRQMADALLGAEPSR